MHGFKAFFGGKSSKKKQQREATASTATTTRRAAAAATATAEEDVETLPTILAMSSSVDAISNNASLRKSSTNIYQQRARILSNPITSTTTTNLQQAAGGAGGQRRKIDIAVAQKYVAHHQQQSVCYADEYADFDAGPYSPVICDRNVAGEDAEFDDDFDFCPSANDDDDDEYDDNDDDYCEDDVEKKSRHSTITAATTSRPSKKSVKNKTCRIVSASNAVENNNIAVLVGEQTPTALKSVRPAFGIQSRRPRAFHQSYCADAEADDDEEEPTASALISSGETSSSAAGGFADVEDNMNSDNKMSQQQQQLSTAAAQFPAQNGSSDAALDRLRMRIADAGRNLRAGDNKPAAAELLEMRKLSRSAPYCDAVDDDENGGETEDNSSSKLLISSPTNMKDFYYNDRASTFTTGIKTNIVVPRSISEQTKLYKNNNTVTTTSYNGAAVRLRKHEKVLDRAQTNGSHEQPRPPSEFVAVHHNSNENSDTLVLNIYCDLLTDAAVYRVVEVDRTTTTTTVHDVLHELVEDGKLGQPHLFSLLEWRQDLSMARTLEDHEIIADICGSWTPTTTLRPTTNNTNNVRRARMQSNTSSIMSSGSFDAVDGTSAAALPIDEEDALTLATDTTGLDNSVINRNSFTCSEQPLLDECAATTTTHQPTKNHHKTQPRQQQQTSLASRLLSSAISSFAAHSSSSNGGGSSSSASSSDYRRQEHDAAIHHHRRHDAQPPPVSPQPALPASNRLIFRQDFGKYEVLRAPAQYFPARLVTPESLARLKNFAPTTNFDACKDKILKQCLNVPDQQQLMPELCGTLGIGQRPRTAKTTSAGSTSVSPTLSLKKRLCVLRNNGAVFYAANNNNSNNAQQLPSYAIDEDERNSIITTALRSTKLLCRDLSAYDIFYTLQQHHQPSTNSAEGYWFALIPCSAAQPTKSQQRHSLTMAAAAACSSPAAASHDTESRLAMGAASAGIHVPSSPTPASSSPRPSSSPTAAELEPIFLCADTEESRKCWIASLRLRKFGLKMVENLARSRKAAVPPAVVAAQARISTANGRGDNNANGTTTTKAITTKTITYHHQPLGADDGEVESSRVFMDFTGTSPRIVSAAEVLATGSTPTSPLLSSPSSALRSWNGSRHQPTSSSSVSAERHARSAALSPSGRSVGGSSSSASARPATSASGIVAVGGGQWLQQLPPRNSAAAATFFEHEAMPWFHKGLSRKDAEVLLKAHNSGVDGVFVVRESSNLAASFVVSFTHGDKIRHAPIQAGREDDVYYFTLDRGTTRFAALSQLVAFYRLNRPSGHHSLPVRLTHHVVQPVQTILHKMLRVGSNMSSSSAGGSGVGGLQSPPSSPQATNMQPSTSRQNSNSGSLLLNNTVMNHPTSPLAKPSHACLSPPPPPPAVGSSSAVQQQQNSSSRSKFFQPNHNNTVPGVMPCSSSLTNNLSSVTYIGTSPSHEEQQQQQRQLTKPNNNNSRFAAAMASADASQSNSSLAGSSSTSSGFRSVLSVFGSGGSLAPATASTTKNGAAEAATANTAATTSITPSSTLTKYNSQHSSSLASSISSSVGVSAPPTLVAAGNVVTKKGFRSFLPSAVTGGGGGGGRKVSSSSGFKS